MDLSHQSFIRAVHLITSCKSWGCMKIQRVCSVLRKPVAMGDLWIPVHLLNLKVCHPPLVCCRCLARLGIMMLTCVGNRFARDLAWFSVIYRENPIWMSVLTTGIGFIYDPMTALRTEIHLWFWEPGWFSVNWRDLAWLNLPILGSAAIFSNLVFSYH